MRRARVRVTGTVQGVGFRPFVYREALELGLAGWVLNDDAGVLIEAEGADEALAELVRRLRESAPPLAEVDAVQVEDAEPLGESDFRIEESRRAGAPDALVSPDMATCEACLAELRDPEDRRYRYPFINCTDCGPRFTIVKGVPYDRPLTTMAGFEMCEQCQAEYDNPLDRRFHAQPNACPTCGPTARLLGSDPDTKVSRDAVGSDPDTKVSRDAVGSDPDTRVSRERDVIAAAAAMLGEGAILAVKGIGGYHLACDGSSETAVAALRSRKRRENKPFALMAPDLAAARDLVELSAGDEVLLEGRERPIVIARRRESARVAASVAPKSRDLGVMLPHAPLQHVLLADFGAPLVMTSANVSDEPIAFVDSEARSRLSGIADAFLVHNRPIHMRTDDSVVRSVANRPPLMMRRARGFVPRSTALPLRGPPALGVGAELKSTCCVAKGGRAWVGHHIGDLKNWETLRSFRESVEHFERVFAVVPEVIAHDLHPDYLSTRYAQDREADGATLLAVQHHHAHLAACLSEHGVSERAVGAIFDGTGYGPDGTVWGGELLVGDLVGFERAGMLMPVRLPGGDRAVQEPWRMAASWLAHAFDTDAPKLPASLESVVGPEDWDAVCGLIATGAGSPLTTSAGRLFDAVAVLCGAAPRVTYEGQAATELEGAADPSVNDAYEMTIEGTDPLVLDPRAAMRAVAADSASGVEAASIAARFHNGLAAATAEACARACSASGLDLVVLSGGVFQNRLLLERTLAALKSRGLRTLAPEKLPPNDGGISYGQVAVATATLGCPAPS